MKPSCPECQTELNEDFGIVTCTSCGAVCSLDLDGNAVVQTATKKTNHTQNLESAENVGSAPSEEFSFPDAEEGVANELKSSEFDSSELEAKLEEESEAEPDSSEFGAELDSSEVGSSEVGSSGLDSSELDSSELGAEFGTEFSDDLNEGLDDSLPSDDLPSDDLPSDDLPSDDLPSDDLPSGGLPEDLSNDESLGDDDWEHDGHGHEHNGHELELEHHDESALRRGDEGSLGNELDEDEDEGEGEYEGEDEDEGESEYEGEDEDEGEGEGEGEYEGEDEDEESLASKGSKKDKSGEYSGQGQTPLSSEGFLKNLEIFTEQFEPQHHHHTYYQLKVSGFETEADLRDVLDLTIDEQLEIFRESLIFDKTNQSFIISKISFLRLVALHKKLSTLGFISMEWTLKEDQSDLVDAKKIGSLGKSMVGKKA